MEISGALAGKRIVITRAMGQGEELRLWLSKTYGARVTELPCVEFRELEDSAALDAAIRSLADYAWILFTSQNAVRFFALRSRGLGVNFAALAAPKPRVACIGPATAEAAAAEGFSPDFVPTAGTGRMFAGSFLKCVRGVSGLDSGNSVMNLSSGVKGMKILLPRSDLALRDRGADDWAEVLREAGAEVTPVVAYRTCAPESLAGVRLEEIRREGADCFVFASPSAFENFARSLGPRDLTRIAGSSVFAALGPTTAAAIRAAGLPCAVEAPRPSAQSLAEVLAEHYARGPSLANKQGVSHA